VSVGIKPHTTNKGNKRNSMKTIKDFDVGQKVKVNEQEIIGKIVLINYDCNEIVIEDLDSEYLPPENQLVYKPDELNIV
jgi:hypothetical protein